MPSYSLDACPRWKSLVTRARPEEDVSHEPVTTIGITFYRWGETVVRPLDIESDHMASEISSAATSRVASMNDPLDQLHDELSLVWFSAFA